MEANIIETQYPLHFRKEETAILGQLLKSRQSVVLIGMKRVGISNFLRFFLYNQGIPKKYITDGKRHLFIPIDLNDLIEREIFPFWTLTLKRIVDASLDSQLSGKVKQKIESLFVDSIQAHDLFLTIDNVRRSLVIIGENGMLPTLFFLRFDRMKDAVTPELFANLQGLRDATHHKLAYVFTSFRSLNILAPSVFTKASLSVFLQDVYIKPAQHSDIKTIYSTYKQNYKLSLLPKVEQGLLDVVDGYVQYLQLSLILLHERKSQIKSKSELFDYLLSDERIALQSEELWENLTEDEKHVLQKISFGKSVLSIEKEKAIYLFDTGYITEKNNMRTVFSPLFDHYIREKNKRNSLGSPLIDFTKKEHLLFNMLREHLDGICEREDIIVAVWPEVEAFGVSDWAIDRLIARIRKKMKLQKSPYMIQTVKTRGYRLVRVE